MVEPADELNEYYNLPKEDALCYQKVYSAYTADYRIWFPVKDNPVVIIPDESMLAMAYGDEIDFVVSERAYLAHGYISFGLYNKTARNKRQQTKFYRGGFNLIYCPINAYFNRQYHDDTDAWMAYAKNGVKTELMTRSTCRAIMDQNHDAHSLEVIAKQGLIGSFQIYLKLAICREIHNKLVEVASPTDILYYRSKHCPYCSSFKLNVVGVRFK